MEEKRLYKRIRKIIKCEVHSDGLTFSSTIDISNGGMFISTPEPLLADSEIELVLYLPGEDPMELKARVKWARDTDSENDRAGMGVQFLNISQDQQSLLDAFAGS